MSRGEGRKYGKGRILAMFLLEEKEVFAACCGKYLFFDLKFNGVTALRQIVPVQQGLFQRAPAEHRAFDARGHMGDITESRGLF